MADRPKINNTRVAVLGLGAMGRALARQLLDDGRSVTVWNRTPARATDLVAQGAVLSSTAAEAIEAAESVIICLLDAQSVRQVLAGTESVRAGRVLINLTTTTPDQARELSAELGDPATPYVGGAIMATPDLIGSEYAALLYSGVEEGFEQHRELLEPFGRSHWLGPDPGAAAMYDLAVLGGMYAMFAAFDDGARMVRTAGGSAAGLAGIMTPFLQAMAASLDDHARGIDTPESYEQVQSDEFTAAAIDLIATTTAAAGRSPELMWAARSVLAPAVP